MCVHCASPIFNVHILCTIIMHTPINSTWHPYSSHMYCTPILRVLNQFYTSQFQYSMHTLHAPISSAHHKSCTAQCQNLVHIHCAPILSAHESLLHLDDFSIFSSYKPTTIIKMPASPTSCWSLAHTSLVLNQKIWYHFVMCPTLFKGHINP